MAYLDLARNALGKFSEGGENPPGPMQEAERQPETPRPTPYELTAQEEAAICRLIEKHEGVAAGSLRLYTPADFRRRFGGRT